MIESLEDVNRLAASGVDDFRLLSFDGFRLIVVGSFDLTYYHDVELEFTDVAYINCPTSFHNPRFAGPPTGRYSEPQRFSICADEGRFEIIAECAVVTIGRVYYYDRGELLQPGERIADWVRRATMVGPSI